MDKTETGGFDFEAMRGVDIRTVEAESLVDIKDIRVNPAAPSPERVTEYLRQIKNPYCFRCGDMVVKISYADTAATIEGLMEGFLNAPQKESR